MLMPSRLILNPFLQYQLVTSQYYMGSINLIKPLLPTAISSSAVDQPWQHQQYFHQKKTLGMPGIKSGSAGCETRMLSVVRCGPPDVKPFM